MKWRWTIQLPDAARRPKNGTEARERAEQTLREVRARWDEVNDMHGRHLGQQEQNNFGENTRLAFGGKP